MYAVDITRFKDETNTDLLLGKDSMDAKRKAIRYIQEYSLAKYDIFLSRDIIDRNLDMNFFSFKKFMLENYYVEVENDLMMQTYYTDKDNCLFVKTYNDDLDIPPDMIILHKDELEKARSILIFAINDSLIFKYLDNLLKYDQNKLNYNATIEKYNYNGVTCEIISLYKNGIDLEELLNSKCSLKQLENKHKGGIDI